MITRIICLQAVLETVLGFSVDNVSLITQKLFSLHDVKPMMSVQTTGSGLSSFSTA